MKKSDIIIGNTYTAKVSDKVVPVRIDRVHPSGGWDATNTVTGKTIRIKSAQRLRAACDDNGKTKATQEATTPPTTPRGAKGAAKAANPAKAAKPAARATERAHGDGPGKDEAEPRKPKPTKPAKPASDKPKRLSLLDAAANVLAGAKEPMASKDIVDAAMAMGWTTGGKTPHATLYAAMTREIATKGPDARFAKVDRGRFVIAKR